MKLKNILMITFLLLTLTPIAIASVLVYKSGYDLSKELYLRNLSESVNVQTDYITKAIQDNMVSELRFAQRNLAAMKEDSKTHHEKTVQLLSAFQTYLENSEDKITFCMLLDKNDESLYTIGESAMFNTVIQKLPDITKRREQQVIEFEISQGVYSLGLISPVWDKTDGYQGTLVSIYNEAYIFKIISSYYKISDTVTYVFREDGTPINYHGKDEQSLIENISGELKEIELAKEGAIEFDIESVSVVGYYKNIQNSPWQLISFVEKQVIYSFTNSFVLVYMFVIIFVVIADILLALYFSKRVVEPINNLIKIIDGYPASLNEENEINHKNKGYVETQYLKSKFVAFMKTITLVRHNFDSIYKLYQSGDVSETIVDINVKNQTIESNKADFQDLLDSIVLPPEVCVVERFANCFCEKDFAIIMRLLENMRDTHLSETAKIEIHSSYLDGKWYNALIVPMYEDDRLSRLFIQLHDVSNFKIQEFASQEKARKDQLTGLYNRFGFNELVSDIIAKSKPEDTHGLLFIDMNYFKMVNDSFGHSTGDKLLSLVADMLVDISSANDIVGRMGGDEFVFFIPNTTIEQINATKEQIKKQLVYPFRRTEDSFTVSASVGIAVWQGDKDDTLQNLLEKADKDMYQAKRVIKQQNNTNNDRTEKL